MVSWAWMVAIEMWDKVEMWEEIDIENTGDGTAKYPGPPLPDCVTLRRC